MRKAATARMAQPVAPLGLRLASGLERHVRGADDAASLPREAISIGVVVLTESARSANLRRRSSR